MVDEISDPGVAATKLAWWRKEVAASFAGQPSHPAMKALMPHAAAHRIEAAHLNAVIEGCQMDLEQSRYLDFAGCFENGVMELRRNGELDGAPALFRMRWENIERESLDWSWQRSDDGGETWTSLWEIEYSRVL